MKYKFNFDTSNKKEIFFELRLVMKNFSNDVSDLIKGAEKAGFTKLLFLMSMAILLLLASPVYSQAPTHLDKSKIQRGCAACHKGHGARATEMLNATKEEFCFTCHEGGAKGRSMNINQNLRQVFAKRSRHPVATTSIYHIPNEELPENDPMTPRHVACADCHRVHVLTKEEKWKAVKGYSRGMEKGKKAEHEYEVCYKCHAESANLPPGRTNKREEFSTQNPSYHPVEMPGRNDKVPSLIMPLTVTSTIFCSDCHGNDDPLGPQGPHGSQYEYLLKRRYLTVETPETSDGYALCYECHDRNSILNDESFQRHRLHVVFNRIPCAACHAPHGSLFNKHLIEFTNSMIDVVPSPTYVSSTIGKPLCYLTCHVGGRSVVHDTNFFSSKNWQ